MCKYDWEMDGVKVGNELGMMMMNFENAGKKFRKMLAFFLILTYFCSANQLIFSLWKKQKLLLPAVSKKYRLSANLPWTL
jgi:hypothetical protein